MILKNPIELTLLSSGEEFRLRTRHNEYDDLRTLINQVNANPIGECGGMGRCAACLVEISSMHSCSAISPVTQNPDIRLACQIPVDDGLANCVVKVLNNR